MAKLFGSQKVQAPPPPEPAPPPPTIDTAATNMDAADRLRKRKGSAATILVPDQFAAATAGPKTLLGQ